MDRKLKINKIMDGNLAMANSIVHQTESEANNPVYPKGTTKEQWDRYKADLKDHRDRVFSIQPKRVNYLTDQAFGIDWLEWERISFMDAPNKPGYYRANND